MTMTIQTLQLQLLKTRYVVRPKIVQKHEVNTKELLKELADLRDRVSAGWKGPADAVKEIRDQRGGDL